MIALGRIWARLTFVPTLLFHRGMCLVGIWRRWDWIDDDVVLGALPTRRDLARLGQLGVTAIVNLCEEFSGHAAELKSYGMTQLRLPTIDYHCPSERDIREGVAFIQSELTGGGRAYLHCKVGCGRSPTLALCYVMARYGMNARDAYERIRRVRPQISRRLYQRPVVLSFARRSATEGESAADGSRA